jgi:hypothetical protein
MINYIIYLSRYTTSHIPKTNPAHVHVSSCHVALVWHPTPNIKISIAVLCGYITTNNKQKLNVSSEGPP